MQNPTSEAIAAKFIILRPLLDEHARRMWAAVEARAMGRGGMSRAGCEWSPQGQPEEVEVHDFPSKTLGKVIPYGVYDQDTNTGLAQRGCGS